MYSRRTDKNAASKPDTCGQAMLVPLSMRYRSWNETDFFLLEGSFTLHDSIRSMAQPGKHEFAVLVDPKRSVEVQIACADFRHGLAYEYAFIGRADPYADEFRIDAVVTAANLYGDAKTSIVVPRNLKDSSVADLIDMSTMRFKQPPDVDGHLEKAISAKDFSAFEFDGSRDD